MGQQYTVKGAVVVEPTGAAGGRSDAFNLAVPPRRYEGQVDGAFPIAGEFELDLTQVPAVKLLVLLVTGGKVVVTVSSTDGGADQSFPVSGLLVLDTPDAPMTAISFDGTAKIEFLAAG